MQDFIPNTRSWELQVGQIPKHVKPSIALRSGREVARSCTLRRLENLKRGLEAVGTTFADVVTALNRVWAEYFRDAKPATTTVQVVRLATDPRCLIEINAVAVVD